MPKFFGTDGIRGKAGEFPLEPKAVYTIGRALGELLRKRLQRPAQVIIGRDGRESGYWIEGYLKAGLAEVDVDVTSAGTIPTPGVAYLTNAQEFDAGIVISASHNPYQDNGIKLFSPSGRKFSEADETFIEGHLLSSTDSHSLSESPTIMVDNRLGRKYLTFLQDQIAAGLSLAGMRLVIDCANGAAFQLAPRLFKNLGAEVTTLGCSPDGYNINEKCGSLHLEGLQAVVKAGNYDLGIAFDGDADRALFVNEKGAIVDGDGVLYLLASDYQRRGILTPPMVIATVMSNFGLEFAFQSLGIELKRTSVGDKYVLEALLNTSALIGGEQSGHIIFPQISLAGDGMITALQVLKVLVEQQKSLSTLMAAFEPFPQVLINVPVATKPDFYSVPAIAQAAQEIEQALVNSGRLLLRYSGTENLARVMIEGPDQATINAQAQWLADVIKHNIG